MRTTIRAFGVAGISAIALASAANAQAQSSDAQVDGQAQSSPAAALAEDGLDDIVVVAQKREERLQDVPVSVGVITGADTERQGINDLESLSSRVPNLTIAESASGNRIAMRGISSGSNRGFEQSVGMFVDGVYAGRARQFTVPFFDVERIEVLRGPQGVLFGKNTVAGAINILTTRPKRKSEIIVSGATNLNFGGYELSAILNMPITDTLALRVSGRTADSDDGPLRNTRMLSHDRGSREHLGRVALRWEPTSSLSVDGKYEYSERRTRGGLFQLIAFGAYRPLFSRFDPQVEANLDQQTSFGVAPGRQNINSMGAHNGALRVQVDFDTLRLVSQSGYSSYRSRDIDEDADYTPVPLLAYNNRERYRQISQELRLESTSDGLLNYVVGGYFQKSRYRLTQEYLVTGAVLGLFNTNPRAFFDQDVTSYSGFGELTLQPVEGLRIIGGARWTKEEKDARRGVTIYSMTGRPETNPALLAAIRNNFGYNNYQLDQTHDESQWSPGLTVQYRPVSNLMLYARASRGYLSGGFNASDTMGDPRGYGSERATSIEAGAKFSAGRRFEANMAVFHSVYKGLQVVSFNGTGFITANAGQASANGVELDARWLVAPRLTLSGSVNYLDATYDDYRGASCTTGQADAHRLSGKPGPCTQDLTGRPLIYASRWSGSANLDYRMPIMAGWSLNGNLGMSYRSAQYVAPDLDPISRQSGYALVDASLSLTAPDDRMNVALVMKNLTDQRRAAYVLNIPVFSGAKGASIIEPRSIEVRTTLRF